MTKSILFRGRTPDAVSSQVAAQTLDLLESRHGPLRECTLVILESEDGVGTPRFKVSGRIDVSYMHGTLTAEPTASDEVLSRAVGRVLDRADNMLSRAKAHRANGEYVAWAT